MTWLNKAGGTDVYNDRAVPPAATFERLRPRLPEFGITRLADQTGFDVIGIPTFAAFRPNASSLAVSQGKGVTSDAARASALMEAVEFSVAERPRMPLQRFASRRQAFESGLLPDISHLLPAGLGWQPTPDTLWIEGLRRCGAEPCYVPLDAVDLAIKAQSVRMICKTTNGLASGNTTEEAFFHGLCEVIERDAESLWSLSDSAFQAGTECSAGEFRDPAVASLIDMINAAGLRCQLFDMTSDIQVPVVACVIQGDLHSATASGSGCHPNRSRAALRAITEAAQSRITGIAGARDDIENAWMEETTLNDASEEHTAPTSVLPAVEAVRAPGVGLGLALAELVSFTEGKLHDAGVDDIFAFPLADDPDFAVVKVLAPELEDRAPNVHWRPRTRALERLVA